MGRRGPPPKPSALKKLEGTYRKNRAAANEIQPTPGAPACPEYLDHIAREEWMRIVPELEKLGVLTLVDRPTLEGYCANYSLARRYQEMADADPMIEVPIVGKGGDIAGYSIKPHPAANAARHHWTLVKQFASEFGLTPSARSRVSGTSGAAPSGGRTPEGKKAESFLFGTGTSGRRPLQAIQGGKSEPAPDTSAGG